MKISESKIALAYIIKESSLSKATKLALLNYVEGLDPSVADKIIDVNEIEQNMKINILMSTGRSLGNLAYNRHMNNAMRTCKDMDEEDKGPCMARYKERGLKAKLNELRKQSTKCGQTTDMSKCRSAFTNAIRNVEAQIRAVR